MCPTQKIVLNYTLSTRPPTGVWVHVHVSPRQTCTELMDAYSSVGAMTAVGKPPTITEVADCLSARCVVGEISPMTGAV